MTTAPESVPPQGPAWDSFQHFAGLDWGQKSHALTVVDRQGKVVLDLSFAHDGEGWASFRKEAAAFPHLAVTVETSCGVVVERLLEAGVPV